jgi:hypothetical protein
LRLPFDLSGKAIAENTLANWIATTLTTLISFAVVGVGFWLLARFRDDGPSPGTVASYLVAGAAASVIVHVARARDGRSVRVISHRAPLPQPALGPPPKFEVSSERLNLPLETLNEDYWRSIPNRAFLTAHLVRVTVRPTLLQSLRGGTLELDPQGARMFQVIGISDMAGMRPLDLRGPRRIQTTLPTLLPGEAASVSLLVVDSFGLEPAFKWFVATADGIELDAGNYTFRDYVEQRNQGPALG